MPCYSGEHGCYVWYQTVQISDVIFLDIHLRGFWLARYRNLEPKASGQIAAQLLQLVNQEVLRTPIAAVYELVDVCAALQHVQQSGLDGKILLRIGKGVWETGSAA
jgi:NADPH:quinone reductase-like Zn-dependent oxidoreductase